MEPTEALDFSKISSVVDRLLDLFERYNVHTTWATVGLLGFENSLEQFEATKNLNIPYTNKHYSPFPLDQAKYAQLNASHLLGKEEMMQILSTSGQELASHTFSHFYCCEEGATSDAFQKDCETMNEIASSLQHTFKSIVFPRNQVDQNCLEICTQNGLTAYRGNQPNRFWTNSTYTNESFLKKAGRYADAYFNISKTTPFKLEELKREHGLLNIPASRFLRPNTGSGWKEKRKINRIKKEMLQAAKNETIYHLWWHPHNFLTATEECLKQLEDLFIYYTDLKDKYGFESLNMSEITVRANA